jgi:hypothetical protein
MTSRDDAQSGEDLALETSRIRLLAGDGPEGLMNALQNRFPDLSDNVFIIAHVPEQGEDLYDVLVDATDIVHVEIPRTGASQPLIERSSLERYRQMHSAQTKAAKRKLDAAVRLAWQRRSSR